MKYLRTDGNAIISYDENADKLDQPFILTQPSHIIKQADTVEELIDEYVFISKSCKEIKKSLEDFNETIDFVLQVLEEPYDIYGAIWVKLPNGAYRLEPVAIVNEEGKLELL